MLTFDGKLNLLLSGLAKSLKSLLCGCKALSQLSKGWSSSYERPRKFICELLYGAVVGTKLFRWKSKDGFCSVTPSFLILKWSKSKRLPESMIDAERLWPSFLPDCPSIGGSKFFEDVILVLLRSVIELILKCEPIW